MRQVALGLIGFAMILWACSSSDSSTGNPGSGGSSSGTAGTNGQSGCNTTACFADAQGGSADVAAPADASTNATTCEPNAATVMKCPQLGSTCTGTDMCCKCIDFPQTPSCGLLWACALPKNNTADCPAEAPSEGSACAKLKVTCQYCVQGAPHH